MPLRMLCSNLCNQMYILMTLTGNLKWWFLDRCSWFQPVLLTVFLHVHSSLKFLMPVPVFEGDVAFSVPSAGIAEIEQT